ncbi:MAG: hypothetical protein EP330_05490 [Deltaproteobacteria bacterium]|nr:MAG: hypothetical protein EP330_05490 [Deltaproteobacteria bacterium]
MLPLVGLSDSPWWNGLAALAAVLAMAFLVSREGLPGDDLWIGLFAVLVLGLAYVVVVTLGAALWISLAAPWLEVIRSHTVRVDDDGTWERAGGGSWRRVGEGEGILPDRESPAAGAPPPGMRVDTTLEGERVRLQPLWLTRGLFALRLGLAPFALLGPAAYLFATSGPNLHEQLLWALVGGWGSVALIPLALALEGLDRLARRVGRPSIDVVIAADRLVFGGQTIPYESLLLSRGHSANGAWRVLWATDLRDGRVHCVGCGPEEVIEWVDRRIEGLVTAALLTGERAVEAEADLARLRGSTSAES